MYIYDSTINRLPTSGQIGVNDLYDKAKTCGATDSQAPKDYMACFDFILGAEVSNTACFVLRRVDQ